MGIQLSGLASGIDTKSLVSGLVAAESQGLARMQRDASAARASASNLSNMSSALSTLRSAASALFYKSDVASFTASSSDSAVVVSASSSASTGSYNVSVNALAKEQRTYSQTFSDHTNALGQSGTLDIQIGSGAPKSIAISATDTLDTIASRINGAGIRAAASVFYDGTAYRLQVRGLDTGSANALTFTENGTSLDLNGTGGTPSSGKTTQAASNASISVDGFTVSSGTNQVTGAIPGVTLALTKLTSSPATVNVAADTSTFSQKITTFVNAYNAVIAGVHRLAGYGTTKGVDANLNGDSALRQVASRLSNAATSAYGSSEHNMLATIGVTSNKDGTLSVDNTKLAAAFTTDMAGVQALLGRETNSLTGGAMPAFRDTIDKLTDFVAGPVQTRLKQFTSQASSLDKRASDEQRRIDRYQANLEKQFTAMETRYSANQSLLAQVQKISSGGGNNG